MRCDRIGDSIFFKEVTEEAGIYSSVIGYGLNVIAGDFNNDNWDDLYISNDFHENDYYYLNNQDGTFEELNTEAFGHTSRFSMGSDAADINNDGWLDLVTLDMLPADEPVLKSSASDDDLDIYEFKRSKGYHHQYSKNCLQLNVSGGKKFSDIGLYAGVAATDRASPGERGPVPDEPVPAATGPGPSMGSFYSSRGFPAGCGGPSCRERGRR